MFEERSDLTFRDLIFKDPALENLTFKDSFYPFTTKGFIQYMSKLKSNERLKSEGLKILFIKSR